MELKYGRKVFKDLSSRAFNRTAYGIEICML